jgi:hypothetical protein
VQPAAQTSLLHGSRRLQYQMLTNKDLEDYFQENPGTGPSHMLDVMESFHRITPI